MWYFYHSIHVRLTVQRSVRFLVRCKIQHTTQLTLSFHLEQFSSISLLQICMIKMGFGRSIRWEQKLSLHWIVFVCICKRVCAWARVCIIMLWHTNPNRVWPCKNNQNTFEPFENCTVSLEVCIPHSTHILSPCSSMQTDFSAILHFASVFVSREGERTKNMIWIWFKRAHNLCKKKEKQHWK